MSSEMARNDFIKPKHVVSYYTTAVRKVPELLRQRANKTSQQCPASGASYRWPSSVTWHH